MPNIFGITNMHFSNVDAFLAVVLNTMTLLFIFLIPAVALQLHIGRLKIFCSHSLKWKLAASDKKAIE